MRFIKVFLIGTQRKGHLIGLYLAVTYCKASSNISWVTTPCIISGGEGEIKDDTITWNHSSVVNIIDNRVISVMRDTDHLSYESIVRT